ncbi:protein enabled homolog [Lethenteron reissneri]|uniref:protein enabled homolog n=1 Tax=Lethenteron reissneri TaxID=7753 RepID=UPI002AB79849|nr:protein enabled homolog [Lethenteron reissneri]
MLRFEQLQLMQQEHLEQSQQFEDLQELRRQVRQLQRQVREAGAQLQTSQRLLRLRAERLQEAFDTRGDALLAEFEASIPDFVSGAERLAKRVEPRRLVMTMAWKVLNGAPLSWDGVLSAVVYCALLVKSLGACGRLGDSEKTRPLTDLVAAVLLAERRSWLMEHGGWVSGYTPPPPTPPPPSTPLPPPTPPPPPTLLPPPTSGG